MTTIGVFLIAGLSLWVLLHMFGLMKQTPQPKLTQLGERLYKLLTERRADWVYGGVQRITFREQGLSLKLVYGLGVTNSDEPRSDGLAFMSGSMTLYPPLSDGDEDVLFGIVESIYNERAEALHTEAEAEHKKIVEGILSNIERTGGL